MKSGQIKPAVLLTCGSLVVSLLLGEIAARLFLPPPFRVITDEHNRRSGKAFRALHRPDPLLGWVLSPGPLKFRHRLVDRSGAVVYDVVYSIENGLRKTSNQEHRGPNLIAAGCSFTFGHGLNDEDTWPWLLQERLADTRVINTGVMGYGTDQALLASERQIDRAPGKTTAVILGLGDFQIDRNRSTQGWLVYTYPFSKPLFRAGPDGVEFQREVHAWGSNWLVQHSSLAAHVANVVANRYYGVPSHEKARELTAALVETFARRFRARGVQLAVVILPYADDRSPRSRQDTAYLLDQLHQSRIPVLLPNMPRLPDGRISVSELMLSGIDQHPNRVYNTLLADQIARFMKAENVGGVEALNRPCCR